MLAILAWAALAVVTLVAVGRESLHAARSEFERQAEAIQVDLQGRLRDNEAALFSFASVLPTVAPDSAAAPRRFAENLVRQYSHIDRLGVVREAAHGELAALLAQARRLAGPEFQIRNFGDDRGQPLASVQERDTYYPLVFVHPQEAGGRFQVGLDLGTIPFLYRALQNAGATGRPCLSPVFPLGEGQGMGYLMLRPVLRPVAEQGGAPPPLLGGQLYAVLAVRVDDLQPEAARRDARIDYRLRHGGYVETVFGDAIFHLPATPAAAIENLILPRAVVERDFTDNNLPFQLRLERQLRLSDLLSPGFVGALVLAVVFLVGLLLYFRKHDRQMLRIHTQEEQIQHLALHDQLTGLPNRRLLEDRLQQAVELARRHGERLGVLFLDLDGFKRVNDEAGHAAGDVILKEISRRLQGCVRESDTVARYGGDEFVMVCSGLQHGSDAVAVAEKVRQAVASPYHYGEQVLSLTPCIGVSVYPDSSENPETLLNQADVAMFRAKSLGRNRIQIFRLEVASALN